MAYIHAKRVGNKTYYTLRISAKQNGRVITKDLCNLGDDLTKVDIDSLEKEYKDKIRKSYRVLKKFLESNVYLEKAKRLKLRQSLYLSKEQLLEIEAIKLHYSSKFLKLDNLTQKEIMEMFMINFAVNSTAIEGNTITLKEASDLFREDIIPKNRTLREVYDLTNTKKAWDFLVKSRSKLDLEAIRAVHDMLLENIDKRVGYRAHDIRIYGQPFKPSPARYVIPDTKLLLDWYNNNKNMHPFMLAMLFHHKFERVHPFSDGNGRTGRMLMNYILFQSKYPPLVISRRFRKDYLDALNEADKALIKGLTAFDEKNYRELIEFLVSQYKLSYWDIFLF